MGECRRRSQFPAFLGDRFDSIRPPRPKSRLLPSLANARAAAAPNPAEAPVINTHFSFNREAMRISYDPSVFSKAISAQSLL